MAKGADLNYRELKMDDKLAMQEICAECFPIEYPDEWFDNLLCGNINTYAHGAFEVATGRMVGMIVGQTQSLYAAELEVGTLLEKASDDDTVVYITIFGVRESHRRYGIGTNLMQGLLYQAKHDRDNKVIYLHVESTNDTAIQFYEKQDFHYFTSIPGYYSLEGNPADGIVYVIFTNGAIPYQGGFRSWCRRYVKQSSVGQCFDGPVEYIKSVVYNRQHSV